MLDEGIERQLEWNSGLKNYDFVTLLHQVVATGRGEYHIDFMYAIVR